ncbi:MAG: hypothetical protein JWM87_776 [Candidatus Eremiobacteraeota bacterium]|nr:hypothetical protein [Candidatus Eremiobacteraeota bacterium]
MADKPPIRADAAECHIVSYADFVRMPEGTIFSTWEPNIVGEPMVKGETWFDEDGSPLDFIESTLGARLYLEDKGGVDHRNPRIAVDRIAGRNGLFEREAEFIVYPPAAIRLMIARLKEALAASASGETEGA